jgi:hypothetical protein
LSVDVKGVSSASVKPLDNGRSKLTPPGHQSSLALVLKTITLTATQAHPRRRQAAPPPPS